MRVGGTRVVYVGEREGTALPRTMENRFGLGAFPGGVTCSAELLAALAAGFQLVQTLPIPVWPWDRRPDVTIWQLR